VTTPLIQRDPAKVEKDFSTLDAFVRVYCKHHHGTNGSGPCAECRDLLDYARGRLERCPLDPKPKCKDCPVHCYKPAHRVRVQEIMRFSGMHFVKRGRLDWLVKYFLRG
jgi:hypothetical protein